MTCSCSNELNSSVGFTVTEYLPCRTFSARSSCFSSTGLAIYMSVYAHEYVCVLVYMYVCMYVCMYVRVIDSLTSSCYPFLDLQYVLLFLLYISPNQKTKFRKIIKTMKIIWHFRRVRSLESCVLTWIFYSFSPGRNRSRFAVN